MSGEQADSYIDVELVDTPTPLSPVVDDEEQPKSTAGELTTGHPINPEPPDDQPARDADKAAWLKFARTRGYNRGDRDATKEQLIADYAR